MPCPRFQIPVVGFQEAEIVVKFLVHVLQRRRDPHAAPHREAQPVRLAGPVVRILPEQHDLRVGIRGEMQRSEHFIVGRVHRSSGPFVGHELV